MQRFTASRILRPATTAVASSSLRFCAESPAGKGTVAMDTPNDTKLEEFANFYTNLTLKEVTTLQKMVFKKMGHSDDFYEQALLRGLGGGGGGGGVAIAAPVATPGADAAAAAKAEEEAAAKEKEEEEAKKKAAKTNFDVNLISFPAGNKIKLIKELRGITSLPLKEAKDAIDKAPGVVAKAMGKEDAEKLKKLFEGLEAKVELV